MTSHEPFSTRIKVRGYEIDSLGHLSGTVYLQYAEHARWECLQEAGIGADTLLTAGIMPVNLETTIRFHQELRFADEADVSCEFVWGESKTGRIVQRFLRADGVSAAEVTSVAGLMDLLRRRLVDDPVEALRSIAKAPEVLGL